MAPWAVSREQEPFLRLVVVYEPVVLLRLLRLVGEVGTCLKAGVINCVHTEDGILFHIRL